MSTTRKSPSPSSPLLHLISSVGAAGGAGDYGIIGCCNFHNEAMRRRAASTTFLYVFVSVFLFASSSLYYYNCRNPIFVEEGVSTNLTIRPAPFNAYASSSTTNNVIQEEAIHQSSRHGTDALSSDVKHDSSVSPAAVVVDTASVLFPGWEVLLIVSPEESPLPLRNYSFSCIYPNNATSPANFSGVLPSTNQTTFKCELPNSNRRRLPFLSPALVARSLGDGELPFPPSPPPKEILWWNFLAYESVSTEDDVVLFVKGLNNRQGVNRSPHEFRCVFYIDAVTVIKTAVTSSIQEVFRCGRPDLTELSLPNPPEDKTTKMSLELVEENVIVPSVAYYTPLQRRLAGPQQQKSLICASTMVYNVAKFLKEWVAYHSSIGVERFILYDNESDDDLYGVVEGLKREGFKIETLFWMWPKAQEAGFSHAAVRANDSCTWLMYLDVDEFLFSPSWIKFSHPSDRMLKSLLPRQPLHEGTLSPRRRSAGQVSIKCNEFGPSNQSCHPAEGVTQGYTCRRKADNRHKSIVLLEAVNVSLANAIHHFDINERRYKWKHVALEAAVVNHYKYQAWSEFKSKFRRRVSAYVVDWSRNLNPSSQDRTPGLGFSAVEPRGWAHKFCEVEDDRLKMLARNWFGRETQNGYKMAWQL